MAGDMFRDIESGKMFIVKSVDPGIIILGTRDGTHSMFVNPNDKESRFLPFVEGREKRNLKWLRKSDDHLFSNLVEGKLCFVDRF